MAKIGKLINRIDGRLKVTGAAQYAPDFPIKNTAHAVIFESETAADAEMRNAKPLEHNEFKIELGRRAIVRALTQAMNGGRA